MNCDAARAAMLEAPPAALTGAGDDDLALHLRGCEGCALMADEMTKATSRLDEALRQFAAAQDVEATLAAVHARLGRGEGADVRPNARREALRTRWPWAGSVLAAAAIASLALWRGDRIDPLPSEPAAIDASRLVAVTQPWPVGPADELSVDSDRRFALIKTDKPTISVVWFY